MCATLVLGIANQFHCAAQFQKAARLPLAACRLPLAARCLVSSASARPELFRAADQVNQRHLQAEAARSINVAETAELSVCVLNRQLLR